MRFEFLDRTKNRFFRRLGLVLREQDVPKVPMRPGDPQRIIRIVSGRNRTIGSQQRQISTPDPLGERPQQEVHVRGQPSHFPPLLSLTERPKRPRSILDVRHQRRENLSPLRVPPRRGLPDLPSRIDSLPQPAKVHVPGSARSTEGHHPSMQLRRHRVNRAVLLKLRFPEQHRHRNTWMRANLCNSPIVGVFAPRSICET